MKDKIKTTNAIWFLLGLLFAGGILLFFILRGYKFVFDPTIENDWEAISATGTWIGAIVATTITAIIFFNQAQLEKHLSAKEQRIALFDMKYKVYRSLSKLLDNSKVYVMNKVNSPENEVLCDEYFLLKTFLDKISVDEATHFDILILAKYSHILGDQINNIKLCQFCFGEHIANSLLHFCSEYENLINALAIKPIHIEGYNHHKSNVIALTKYIIDRNIVDLISNEMKCT